MKFQRLMLAAAVAAAFLACSDDENTGGPSGAVEFDEDLAAEALENYAGIVHASYLDTLSGAEDLQAAVDAFLEDPSEDTLADAREAWLAARESYLQTEVFRFYEGPIDNADDGPEGFINSWPLDESYIDYVEGNDSAGIINDTGETIDADTLMGLNEDGAEDHIATGYHAIEFLLWGQDMNDDGPGDRPYTDFVVGEGGTAENQDRRRVYLNVVSDLLVMHLAQVSDQWTDESEDNYRLDFLAAEPADAVQRVLTGMVVLSGFETGGERLQTALDTGSQEDEHSCFSDNTHRDMVQDVRGIQNVLLGRYEALDGDVISGPGIYDVIDAADPELAEAIEDQVDESLALAQDLQPPFDQEISPENQAGRARVEALIDSLLTQRDHLNEAFELFGFEVPVVE